MESMPAGHGEVAGAMGLLLKTRCIFQTGPTPAIALERGHLDAAARHHPTAQMLFGRRMEASPPIGAFLGSYCPISIADSPPLVRKGAILFAEEGQHAAGPRKQDYPRRASPMVSGTLQKYLCIKHRTIASTGS
jgi:hypothetical protein